MVINYFLKFKLHFKTIQHQTLRIIMNHNNKKEAIHTD